MEFKIRKLFKGLISKEGMEENNSTITEVVRAESEFSKKFKSNPWMGSTFVLGIAAIILLAVLFYPRITGNVVSGDSAGASLVDYLNTRTGGGVSFVSAEPMGSNLYSVMVSYQNQTIPVYVSKDGKYFVQGAVPIAEEDTPSINTNTQNQQPANVPKSDKPKAELFVMTHCPYGTQAEKGIIPAIKALGTSADVKIRFVHYFMHGEKEEFETYNQVCIREEQSAKYLDYLSCFLEAGDSAACIKKIGIDQTKLNTCLANDKKKAKEYYEIDKALSNQYGVQGSPTLVINGVEANSGRDSASYLTTICSAFNTPGTACSQKLSSASPSPGFGTATATGSAAASAAQCG